MRRTQMKRIISIILCVALLACVSQLFASVDIMAATRSGDLSSAENENSIMLTSISGGTPANLGETFYAKISTALENECQGYELSLDNINTGGDRNSVLELVIEKPSDDLDHIWKFVRGGAEGAYYYKIINMSNSKHLDNPANDAYPEDENHITNNNVIVYEGNDGYNQKWQVYDSGNGTYYISPMSDNNGVSVQWTNPVMDVLYGDYRLNGQVGIYDLNYGPNQQFKINVVPTVPALTGDKTTVTSDAIKFSLFNYNDNINRVGGVSGQDNWRTLAPYFSFYDFSGVNKWPNDYLDKNRNNYDDGYNANHATVETTLDSNGYPTLRLDNKKDSNNNTLADPLPNSSDRSLAYLFGGDPDDKAVEAYSPANTLLQEMTTTNGVKHYYYNSKAGVSSSVTAAYANAADYDQVTKQFRVRNYTENITGVVDATSTAEFLPFCTTYSLSEHTIPKASVDYWFGMRMDVDFIQGANGKIGNEEMVFNFTGDDDVWVFIDGVLVLDMGGTHDAVTGSINFSNGEVTTKGTWTDAPSYTTSIYECFNAVNKADTLSQNGTFADYSSHTLSMFYLERGAGLSTCCIDFNMPTPPDNSIEVSNDVVDTNGYSLNSSDKTEYIFRITRSDGTSLTGEELNYTFGTESKTLGSDGIFTLKGGQSVYFTNLSSDTNYKIQEITDGTAYQNYIASTTVSEDGGEPTTGTSITVKPSEATKKVAFVNTLKNVAVTVQNNIQCTNFEKLTEAQQRYYTGKTPSTKTAYQITVTNLNGNKLSTLYYRIGDGGDVPVELKNDVGEFSLSNGARATFTIPAGYNVTIITKPDANTIERFDYNYSVDITNGDTTVTGQPQTTESGKEIAYVFTNTYTMQTTPLTINTEISTKLFTDGTKPEQGGTVLYRIKGVSGDLLTQHIDLQVSAKSNSDGTIAPVKINGLPVGEYKVTQEKAWIWRDTLSTVDSNVTNPTLVDNTLSFTLPKQDGNYLTFNDEITYNKWVDGNSYIENKFN